LETTLVEKIPRCQVIFISLCAQHDITKCFKGHSKLSSLHDELTIKVIGLQNFASYLENFYSRPMENH